MRTNKQRLECLRKAISNSIKHIEAGDPRRIYSQYIRYALDEFADLNFYTSTNAHGRERNFVIHEHVIPHSIVMGKLLALSLLTDENIMSVLKEFYFICKITRDEDKRLNKAGLRSKMPNDWDGRDPWARYTAVGIERYCAENNQASNGR